MPTISVLITTYNRKDLLKRCLDSVLAQTFTPIEVIVIDDASTDGTEAVVSAYTDPRIRYIRNAQNVGAAMGDRAHIRRFVHELAQGRYFVYLCDDDFWPSPDLLARQMALFLAYPNAAMVMGGQLSRFIPGSDIFADNALPKEHMTSIEFLDYFARNPVTANIIIGATLYSMEHFIRSGALATGGAQWQAGYEMLMGPGCYGDVVYINEPCVVTEIRPTNASFQRTQIEHYLDSVYSVIKAFEHPMKERPHLRSVLNLAIENLSKAFLANAESIRQLGGLNMCSEHNTRFPVTPEIVETTHALTGVGIPAAA